MMSRRRLIKKLKVMDSRVRAASFAGAAALMLFVGLSSISVLTGQIAVSPTKVTDQKSTLSANDLRPDACRTAGVTVTNVLSGGTSMTASNSGDLMLAGGTTTSMTGGSGDDCIVGSGTIVIDGGGGTNDVCIGDVSAMTNCETQVAG